MQYLKPLITWSFWTNAYPPSLSRIFFIILGVLALAFAVAGTVAKVLALRNRRNPPLYRVYSRVGRFALSIGAVGLLLCFFSYEQIPYVSARYWWLLLAVGGIVWAVFIVKDFLKRYPLEKRALLEKLAKEKYLPKA